MPGARSCRVSYSVIYAIDLGAIPDRPRVEIEKSFRQIAEAVAGISETSPFFSSIDDSTLQIDVEGWRLVYRLEPKGRMIKVIEATQLPPRR